jgi:hypothetical protein
MDEPTAASSNNPTITQKSTGKLPPENTTNNSAPSTTESAQTQPAEPYQSLQLTVIE